MATDLQDEIAKLGPWAHDVQVTPDVSTKAWLDQTDSGDANYFRSSRDSFLGQLEGVYPTGLEGRTVLDCGCNCGALLFWAKEFGAGDCFGFDVREHWIEQARFLLRHRNSNGMRFEVRDLYDLPSLEPFDMTIFKGLFYHLPDPITGLKIAADLTSELLVFDSSTRPDLPDGLLAVSEESKTHGMSGVYGLNWFPTGPEVMTRIFHWLGFVETHVLNCDAESKRLWMLASKRTGLLEVLNRVAERRTRRQAVESS